MNEFAELITQPTTVYIFVAIILLVALRPLYLALVTIGLVNRDLSNATAIITRLGRDKLQDEFYNHFKEIHSQISRIEVLRHAWREFVDSTYFGQTSTHKKVYLSHRPSHYFNRDSVLGKRLNLSQFFAYPNYLIGIGLTFTFIGLATALHVAQAGLASGSGQQALKNLLAVASIKFVSSIAGIVSSLVIASLQRVRVRQFQQKLSVFCDLLEECTEYKSTEKLLHDNLSEQRKHTALLTDMGNQIVTGMSTALAQQLPASVSAALDALTQEMRGLAGTFAKGSEDAMRHMADSFFERMNARSQEEMNAMLERVQSLRQVMGALVAQMETAGNSFSTDTRESAARLGAMLDQMSGAFAPVSQGLGQWGRALGQLEGLTGKIEQAGYNIAAAADSNQKSAGQFSGAVQDMSGRMAPINETLQGLQRSLNQMAEAAAHIQSAGATISSASERFGKADNSLGAAFSELAKGSEALRTGVQSLSSLLNDPFARAVASLEQSVAKLDNMPVGESKAAGYFGWLKSKKGG